MWLLPLSTSVISQQKLQCHSLSCLLTLLPGKSVKGFFDQAITFTIQIAGDKNPGSSAMELREMWLSGQACCYQPSAFPGHSKSGICISILQQESGRY